MSNAVSVLLITVEFELALALYQPLVGPPRTGK